MPKIPIVLPLYSLLLTSYKTDAAKTYGRLQVVHRRLNPQLLTFNSLLISTSCPHFQIFKLPHFQIN